MKEHIGHRGRFLLTLLTSGLAACSADSTPEPDRGGGGANGFGNSDGRAGRQGSGSSDVVPIGDGCAAISQTAVNRLQPADIIIAIDNSGSMDEEIVFVREQMNAFSQQIIDSGVDVRIIVISAPLSADGSAPIDAGADSDGDSDEQENGVCIDAPLGSGACPSDSHAPRYLHVPVEVSSNDALNLFVETFPEWRSQLRPNATKTFVVVTDDDATDEPNDSAAAFTSAVSGLDAMLFEGWSFSGIYCFSECPEAAEIGQVYMDLVAQTGGVSGDLCLQDFAPVFDALAQAVIGASGVDCEWAIPPPPAGQTFDTGRVNVQYTPSSSTTPIPVFYVPSLADCSGDGGWFYDDRANPTQVRVCPSTCARLENDPETKLDVLFGCETSAGPD